MVDSVLSSLLQVLAEKLASPLLEKFRDLYHLRENIKKLHESLPIVQQYLQDAQKRQATEKDIKKWLLQLTSIAYESEELLDEIEVEITLCERRSSSRNQVRRLFLPYEPSEHLFELACELPYKLKELDDIIKQRNSLKLTEGSVVMQSQCLGIKRGTGSSVIESDFYGREEDKKKLLELLLPTRKGKAIGDVLVIPIVGMGGLGKTTLARLVYKDKKVTDYFELKLWIYVSETFDVKKLVIGIIQSATERKCELLEMDLLQLQLQKLLCGKRFLLVLDDVWNEDPEQWDELRDLLRCGAEESRIIVTTRSQKVASIVGPTSLYNLEGLLEDDCLALFKRRAFYPGEEEHPNLLEIGKRLVKKCGGVPLAAESLGYLLRFSREEKYWLVVEASELWNLDEYPGHILPVLKLTYIHLPLPLKRCFAFCSLLPKNYEIKKDKMIHIWMAEGLTLPCGGNRLLEDIGEEYFNDLLHFFCFQEVEKCEDSNTAIYKMNDLFHDLARSVGGNDFAIIGHGLPQGNLSQTRHASIVCNFDSSSFPNDLLEAKHLRTLLFLFPGGNPDKLPSFLHLRVLDLSSSGIKRLDESFSVLICLRYLDLSSTSIQTLPHTICKLYKLQTLNLSRCTNLVELPLSMASLINLRHLNITGCEGLADLPPGIGKLVHLQTLPTYIVGKRNGESIAELKSLDLRGELDLKCLENIRNATEASMANLRKKQYLDSLSFKWGNNKDHSFKPSKGSTSQELKYRKNLGLSGSSRGNGMADVEDIFECLEPHQNLRKLFVKGYPGIKLPGWDLPNLVVIVLINCRRCKNVPTLGQLPFLKTLYLQGMDGVVRIAEEFYSVNTRKLFPSLKDLTLRDFPNLEEWSCIDHREAFTCLQKLIMDKCPNLKTAPEFPVLQHLELRDCHPKIINSMESITSLSVLVIDKFPDLLHLSGELLENNTCLTSLEICSCRNLQSLPSELENLTGLKSLIISCCEELTYLPIGLQKLKALELLEINGCHNLILLPDDGIGGLSSLQTLSIENCRNLISLSNGICHLTALKQLSIMSCPKFDSLPDIFQYLSALRSLNIVSCPGLVTLPSSLQHVNTLHRLVIHSCSGLLALPDWFGNFSSLRSLAILNCKCLISLPEGLQHLSSLQHLSIQDCPQLERLCKKMRGKEWQKISHIPHIYIGSLKLRKELSSLTS